MAEMTKEKKFEQGILKSLEKAIEKERGNLFSYSFRFEVGDLLPILTHPSDKNTSRIYWEQPYRGFSFAGLGSIAEFNSNNFTDTSKINRQINNTIETGVSVTDNSLIGPRIFGGFAFNKYLGDDTTWKNFPLKHFLLPECLGTSTDDGTWLTISRMIQPSDKLDKIVDEFKKTITYYETRLPVTLPPITRVSVDKFRDVPEKSTYDKTIFSLLGDIKPGKLEKVVISRSHHVKVGRDFSVISAMQVLRNAYPKCMSFFYSFPNEGIFFGSTPERLIKFSEGSFETEALAGTIPRGKNMEEDRLLAETLLESHKEREEHRYVLEQIQRKLAGLSDDLESGESPQIFKLKNVQHLKTPIFGTLNSDMHILELVNRLHPTPAVAGTPTADAIAIIDELETHDRGWYCGPIGWTDIDGNGEFFVGLRSALVSDNEAHVFAGGGIVSESIAEREWEETELKIQPILTALSGGQI